MKNKKKKRRLDTEEVRCDRCTRTFEVPKVQLKQLIPETAKFTCEKCHYNNIRHMGSKGVVED